MEIHRLRLRTASLAGAKPFQVPRAARPPVKAESGRKRNRRACSSWSSSAPASRAKAHPRPAPAGKIQSQRRGRRAVSAAVLLIVHMVAVRIVELAAEEAGALDQVQPLAPHPGRPGGPKCPGPGWIGILDEL